MSPHVTRITHFLLLCREKTTHSNSARAVPRDCSPSPWGISCQGCPSPWGISHWGWPPSQAHGASPSSQALYITPCSTAPTSRQPPCSMLGPLHILSPQAWQGTRLSCINYVPFIFSSPWRDLEVESTAQTVSAAGGSAGTMTYGRAGTLPPARGSTTAQHQAKPKGPGMPQGTASKQGRDRGRVWLLPPEQPHQGGARAVL